MKMINFLIQCKKKRVNKNLYMIQTDYLKFRKKEKKKLRKNILRMDEYYQVYLNDNTTFSENDYILFENNLKKLIKKNFI